MTKCLGVGCDERGVKNGWCGPHYNEVAESEESDWNTRELTPTEKKKQAALKADLNQDSLGTENGESALIDLEWWLETYGDQAMPAKFMNQYYWVVLNWDAEEPPDPFTSGMSKLDTSELMTLTDALKDLEGIKVGDAHVWRFDGKRHYKREGPQNHFRCAPIEQ